ncbi:hypothetical protein ODJ79_32260 [Actinoplanes sp. KI2]|uniref:hypothetical protein n=1 Tax=Actinoplanes sp. KI2 TaxID=2983315 RepID=UPI0021D578AC|nr:hypothetical protein [Actinoplanes sp. KI2]MCU7728409.1 hypothetical protein [Actinoplanes sp. KI2]
MAIVVVAVWAGLAGLLVLCGDAVGHAPRGSGAGCAYHRVSAFVPVLSEYLLVVRKHGVHLLDHAVHFIECV